MDRDKGIRELKEAIKQAQKDLETIEKNKWKIDEAEINRIKNNIAKMKEKLREEKEYREKLPDLVRRYNVVMRELSTAVEPRKSELEAEAKRLAFEINKLNGIVDPKVEKRDKHQLDEAEKFLMESEKNQLLQDLSQELLMLREKIERLKELQAELAKLAPDDPNRASKQAEIDGILNEIKGIGDNVKNITSKLKDGYGKNIELGINFDEPDKIDINNIDDKLKDIEKQIETKYSDEKKKAMYQGIVDEVLDRYGIEAPESSLVKQRFNGIKQSMDSKVSEIRASYIPERVNNLSRNMMPIQRKAPTSSQQQTQPAPSTPQVPQASTSAPSIPPVASAGRTTQGPSMSTPSGPSTPSGRITPATPPVGSSRNEAKSPSKELKAEKSERPLKGVPIESCIEEEFTMPNDLEFSIENDENHPMKIENGRVYRYVPVDDRLFYISEDLDIYLSNPKKMLDTELKGLRKRMEEIVGGKKELEEICEEMREANGGKETRFTNLVSGGSVIGGLKRIGARDELTSDLDEMGPIAQVQMLIALRSAVTPEQISRVLKKPANPYEYESDLVETISFKENKRLFKKELKMTHKEKPQLMDVIHQTQPNDVEKFVFRPFDITPEEMGETRQTRMPSDKQRTKNGDPKPEHRGKKDSHQHGKPQHQGKPQEQGTSKPKDNSQQQDGKPTRRRRRRPNLDENER